jgi:hypothetical protein
MIQSILPRDNTERLVALLSAAMFVFLCWAALDKPHHIDDTLFARSAQAWRERGDPLAFEVNWGGTPTSGADVMQNPPMMSALVLATESLLGHSELGARAAAVLALALLALAVYRLAAEVGVSRVWTVALACASPAVAVSAGSIMADTLCAALLTLGVAEWMRFVRERRPWPAVSAVLILCGAALTKHAGLIALIPCLVWTLHARPVRRSTLFLLTLPVLAVLAYTLWLIRVHDPSALSHAFGFNRAAAADSIGVSGRIVVACAFLGGASISGVMFAATARGPEWRTVILCSAIAASLALLTLRSLATDPSCALLVESDGSIPRLVKLEFIAFVTAGSWVAALVLTRASHWQRPVRDMLGAWIVAGLIYVLFVNWDISMRAFLPLIGPLCVIGAGAASSQRSGLARTACAALLVVSIAVSSLLTVGDREFALAAREDAWAAGSGYYFLGHWGFQHYAEARGGVALDNKAPKPPTGSRVVVPMSNSIGDGVPRAWVESASMTSRELKSPLVTLGPKSGAGFYASRFGPLPFAVRRGDTMDTWTLILR